MTRRTMEKAIKRGIRKGFDDYKLTCSWELVNHIAAQVMVELRTDGVSEDGKQ